MDKTAFYNLSYGVYLCTTWDEGRPVGCVANSAMQITSKSETIAVSINRLNYTHKCIEDCGFFAIAVMGEHCDPKLIGTFGFRSGKDTDKFADFPYSIKSKLPVPDDCVSYFICKVADKMETVTHTVFLGEVLDCGNAKKDAPMTYAYYHKVLKGKTAANAPTFNEAPMPEEEKAVKYVCNICSYEYKGDVPFEDLPDDWVCPICGVGKEEFRKVETTAAATAPKRKKGQYVCKICGYVYDGDVPFEELPDDWVCPLCGAGKDQFEKID